MMATLIAFLAIIIVVGNGLIGIVGLYYAVKSSKNHISVAFKKNLASAVDN